MRLKVKLSRAIPLLVKAWFLGLVCGLAPGAELYAQKRPESIKTQAGDAEYNRIKEDYLRLRNTDAGIAYPERWTNLTAAINSFIDRYPKHPSRPFAIFKNAVLFEQLYRRFGDKENLHKSCRYLQQVADLYPKDDLADDALVGKADLLLYDLEQVKDAAAIYTRVLDQLPGSDMAEVARARLRSIQSGEHKVYLRARESKTAAVGQPGGKRVLVMLDPGHGGEDFGAAGQGGLLEKDVVLAIAFELEKILVNNLGLAVRLTRTQDVFVPLAERIRRANDYEADLFVSLHTNASPQGKISGLETYYLDSRGDEASRLLVERENSSVKFEPGEGDLQFMLGDLIQNAKLEESIVLANLLQRALVNRLQGRWDSIRDLGVRKAPFYVLVGAHMPCVLVELFYIDHVLDGQRLAEKEFRREIAFALAQGLESFLSRRGLLAARDKAG